MNNQPDPNRHLLLKPEDAARELAIGRTQLYALLASGDLDSVQIGRLRRVPYAACQRYVARLESQKR